MAGELESRSVVLGWLPSPSTEMSLIPTSTKVGDSDLQMYAERDMEH